MFKALSAALRLRPVRALCEPLRGRRRGFVLIAFTLSALFLLGVTGLAFDVGRMYVTRSEGQAFVDSAALAGVLQLDGTKDGLLAAELAAQENRDQRKRWAFNTESFSTPEVTFSNQAGSGFVQRALVPDPPVGYKYIRVAAKMNVPLTLLRLVVSATGSDVAATAVASQVKMKTISDGVFPFAPMAPNPSAVVGDEDSWGFTPGQLYTLQWASNPDPNKPNTVCPGDANPSMVSRFLLDQNRRGFIVEKSSADDIAEAVLNGTADYPITEGSSLMTTGDKEAIIKYVNDRVNADLDPTRKYDPLLLDDGTVTEIPGPNSYLNPEHLRPRTGNGYRIVIVPINSGAPTRTILGFARFLLQPAEYNDQGGAKPLCAWYIGPGIYGGHGKPVENDGIYRIALVR